MTIPFTLSRDALTAFIDGVPLTINSSHPNYEEVVEMLKSPADLDVRALEAAMSFRATLENKLAGAAYGDVTVGQDAVLYKGRPIHSYLTKTMLDIIAQGHDISPWAKFMDKLYRNPSKTAVDELFLWLQKANMPITSDGNFLAYKKVKDDYTSFHTNADGTAFHNTIGTTVEMPRNEVDDDRNRTCSKGLHFCSWHYLPSYHGNAGRVVVVEIDPADVVSIPSDYDNAKGRASRYKISGEIEQSRCQHAFDDTPIADWEEDYED